MNRETNKRPKMEMKVVQMIERVRAGEDAEDVIRDTDKGKGKKDDSGGLKEDIGRFLDRNREKR